MPIADFTTYCKMLDRARENRFAYPAINVTSTDTANAALMGFAEAGSDGIIQVSTGGAQHASGEALKDMVAGAVSLATHIRIMAEKYDVFIALHTDHCQPGKLDSFLKPLIRETAERRARGEANLFSSHMFDGSELPLKENLEASRELLRLCAENRIILEIETGVVGGEEDGVSHEGTPAEKLYTTPGDMVEAYRVLSGVENARFMLAATFGNVHGVYKPGNVVLKPNILKDGQQAVAGEFGDGARFDLVFHGGSSLDEIHETLEYGVVKMNIDTDTQYAFTRPVVDHMFTNYDGVLKVDGEVGVKKVYDPRSYLKKGSRGMADRVIQACRDLKSHGQSLKNN
jgi:fructose-bisphosphate aldolase class II